MLIRNLRPIPLLAVASVLVAGQVSAATITASFTVDVLASSSPSFPSGQSASGTFSWSDSSPLVSSDGTTAIYDVTGSAEITLGGIPSTLPITQLAVSNDRSFGGFIRDGFVLASADGSSSQISLDDTTGTALSSVSIPTSLDLAAWDFMRFDITLPDGSVFGTLTSITVPEPGVAALLLLSPLGLRALRD